MSYNTERVHSQSLHNKKDFVTECGSKVFLVYGTTTNLYGYARIRVELKPAE